MKNNRAFLNKESYIKKEKGKYCVKSKKNPSWNGGCYDSKEKAKERLKQVEMFKHMKTASTFSDLYIQLKEWWETRYNYYESDEDWLNIVLQNALFDQKISMEEYDYVQENAKDILDILRSEDKELNKEANSIIVDRLMMLFVLTLRDNLPAPESFKKPEEFSLNHVENIFVKFINQLNSIMPEEEKKELNDTLKKYEKDIDSALVEIHAKALEELKQVLQGKKDVEKSKPVEEVMKDIKFMSDDEILDRFEDIQKMPEGKEKEEALAKLKEISKKAMWKKSNKEQ